MYESIFKPLLFRVDPEEAHHLAFRMLQAGSAFPIWSRVFQVRDSRLQRILAGCQFPNPVGLAAGFDKNGEAVSHWERLGFGFCEIGTVTAKPQPGNPRPRLFRLPEDRALINRMGFNNWGAELVAQRLRETFARRAPKIPVGINIGKSKVTPNEEAVSDYLFSLERLYEFSDYLVVNVSSPNTPGLRDLQEKESLTRLLSSVLERGAKLAGERGLRERALFVKLAPDLDDDAFGALIRMAVEIGLAGVIVNNTTLSRASLRSELARESGGLSGAPLTARAHGLMQRARAEAGDKLVLIGSGGIMTPEDAVSRLEAGADLIQIYTGFVYEGPRLPCRICRAIR